MIISYPDLDSLKLIDKLLIIYSGSFSPPHIGHMNVIINIMSLLPQAKLIMVPVNDLYPKPGLIVGSTHRLEMCELLIGSIKWLYPDFNLSVSSFTFQLAKGKTDREVMLHFSEKYPNYRLAFIVGRDVFDRFDTWDPPNRDEILSGKYEIIVYPRTDGISSSDIKSQFKKNGELINLTESVRDYLIQNDLLKN